MSKKSKKGTLKNPDKYRKFVIWMATPEPFRVYRFGKKEVLIDTQQKFAQMFRIGEDTLSHWKHNQPNFWKDVDAVRQSWGKERTANVLATLYKFICAPGEKKEFVPAVKLWLQYVEEWREKTELTSRITYEDVIDDLEKDRALRNGDASREHRSQKDS